jgi:hypothetical protein
MRSLICYPAVLMCRELNALNHHSELTLELNPSLSHTSFNLFTSPDKASQMEVLRTKIEKCGEDFLK